MNKSISSQIYESVLNDILSDQYKPGQMLTERELMEKYVCSKTTVREALVALGREGVVKNIPRCGYQVVRIEPQEISDMLEYRYFLEKSCLESCIDRIQPQQIQRLWDLNGPCVDPTLGGDLWSHWDYNTLFHLELISLSGNKFAHDNLRSVMNILKRAYAQHYWNRWNRTVVTSDMKNHAVLIEALERRDMAAASLALKEDLKDFAYL